MSNKKLPICAGILAEYREDFRPYPHIIVQHLQFDTVEIVDGLVEIGCDVRKLIAIDYSCDTAALEVTK
jgi:hypothetical protein